MLEKPQVHTGNNQGLLSRPSVPACWRAGTGWNRGRPLLREPSGPGNARQSGLRSFCQGTLRSENHNLLAAVYPLANTVLSLGRTQPSWLNNVFSKTVLLLRVLAEVIWTKTWQASLSL